MSPQGQLDHYIDSEDFKVKRPSLRVLTALIRDLAKEKVRFGLGVLLVLLGTWATLYEPRLFGQAIDRAILTKDSNLLFKFAIFYLGLILLRVACVFGQLFVFEWISQNTMQRLRLRVFSLYQRLPLSTFDRTPVGRLITRLTNDTSSMNEMFASGFVTFFSNAFFILGSIVWMFHLHFELAFVSLAVFPVLIGFSIRFSKRLIEAYRLARMRISSLNAFLAENILGMKVVHLFNRASLHFEKFQNVNRDYADAQIASVRVYAYFQPLITWCSGVAVALALLHGGYLAGGHFNRSGEYHWLGKSLTPGEWVTFLTYLLALFQPVREVVDRWTIFLSGMTSAERIYSLFDWETELTEEEASTPVKDLLSKDPGQSPESRGRGRVEFQDVWFAYVGENWVLRGLSFSIDPGEKIGVVGHTGAGKSTLISLLLRFYEPQRGKILIDGKDIREIPKRELRLRIGLIQQEVFLFSGTIEENVRLWEGESMHPESREILNSSPGLEEFKSELDERGSNLSMGERQVLAFARAIEKDPELWILDEATSNIDSETERRFLEDLEKATRSKTLVMIAHRLATLKSADRIFVLHKGALVESGSPRDLLRQEGYYSRLYRYQEAVERRQDSGSTSESPG